MEGTSTISGHGGGCSPYSLVLLAGLWNMLRGTSPNLSQTLMRWRVGLQFLAIVLMMMLVYLWRS